MKLNHWLKKSQSKVLEEQPGSFLLTAYSEMWQERNYLKIALLSNLLSRPQRFKKFSAYLYYFKKEGKKGEKAYSKRTLRERLRGHLIKRSTWISHLNSSWYLLSKTTEEWPWRQLRDPQSCHSHQMPEVEKGEGAGRVVLNEGPPCMWDCSASCPVPPHILDSGPNSPTPCFSAIRETALLSPDVVWVGLERTMGVWLPPPRFQRDYFSLFL